MWLTVGVVDASLLFISGVRFIGGVRFISGVRL
jgi:hypothetical protein